MQTKFPPIEKIAEAYSVIADKRLNKVEEHLYHIESSNKEKIYSVKHTDNTYSSNDSATFWQSYAGYPIIAVMMHEGTLPIDYDLIDYLSGINWTEVNKKNKRDYAKALEEIFNQREINPDIQKRILNQMEITLDELKKLDINIVKNRAKIIKPNNS